MNLKNGFNLKKIAARDKWKGAFYAKQGLFKYIVIPFSLSNTAASFQEMIDIIFKDVKESIWYLNDMLIHGGNTEVEHEAK